MPYATILRQARLTRGETREIVAVRAGVSHATISMLERGQVEPKLVTLRRVAEALDLDLAALVAAAAEQQTATIIAQRVEPLIRERELPRTEAVSE